MINKRRVLNRIETATYIEVARAIANQPEINEYLADLGKSPIVQGHEAVKKWITTTLKKYLLNKHDDVKRYKPKSTDPKWLQDDDEPLTVILSNKFKQDIEHALGYLTTAAKPDFVTVPDAIKFGEKHLVKQQKEASDEESDDDVKVLHEWDNGYRMLSLLTQQALAREGKIMGHCVGSEQQNYIAQVKAGTMEVWSLRDAKNQPHATIEYRIKEKQIKQIKGKGNKGVVAKYIPYIKGFFALPQIKKQIENFDKNDLLNINILEQGGVWYDILNLPENFVVEENLDLEDTQITTLPAGLTIANNLSLRNSKVIELPTGITIGGDLNLAYSDVSKLPDNLAVGGDLILEFSKIEKLPKGLSIKGSLLCENSQVTEFSSDLTVKWDIKANYTKLTKIGSNLKVGGDADFEFSDLTSFPKGAKIGGSLSLRGCPISELPTDLKVGDHLNIHETDIAEISDQLESNVGGNIYSDF